METRSSKAALRRELLRLRDSLPEDEKKARDESIRRKFFTLPEISSAGTIFFFASFRSETDTFGLMKDALSLGRKIVLPKVDGVRHELALFEIRSLEELKPGYMGIPEPTATEEGRRRCMADVQAVVIPGAGFDSSGNRLGYGGGYYDRLLSSMPPGLPVVAPAYELQIAENIPSEPHDIKVGLILTERRVIKCIPR